MVANEVRAAAERSVAAAGLEEGEALDLAVGLARFRLAPRRGFVAITFGDGKMIPHMLNWVHHVREARIPHIVVSDRADESLVAPVICGPWMPFMVCGSRPLSGVTLVVVSRFEDV